MDDADLLIFITLPHNHNHSNIPSHFTLTRTRYSPDQTIKTRRSEGAQSEVVVEAEAEAERSIPTPVSIADELLMDMDMNMDEDGDVLMGEPMTLIGTGTSVNPIQLLGDDDVSAARKGNASASASGNGNGKLSPRKLYALHVSQLTELWGDRESVIRGEFHSVAKKRVTV